MFSCVRLALCACIRSFNFRQAQTPCFLLVSSQREAPLALSSSAQGGMCCNSTRHHSLWQALYYLAVACRLLHVSRNLSLILLAMLARATVLSLLCCFFSVLSAQSQRRFDKCGNKSFCSQLVSRAGDRPSECFLASVRQRLCL